jgi:hypothetical protein
VIAILLARAQCPLRAAAERGIPGRSASKRDSGSPPRRLPFSPGARSAGSAAGASDGPRVGVHIELFVRRQVLIVLAGIGVARPWRGHLARLTPGGCTYPARTLEPTGVIEVSPGAGLTLGDVFRLWGQAARRGGWRASGDASSRSSTLRRYGDR